MTINVDRFSDRAAAYERYRSRFPSGIVERLRDVHGLTRDDIVADIGAGTGMLAELFLENGNCVYAVEPNAAMRAGCDRLRERYPRLTVLGGAAESTGLADASIDLIVVGRAFHWFDKDQALREFARVLKPGGHVLIVASRWDGDGSAAARHFEEILRSRAIDYQKVLDARLREEDVASLFAAADLLQEDVHGEQSLTFDELVGRAESLSVTPLPGHPQYAPFRRALEEYFATYAEDGLLRMSVSFHLVCGALAPRR